MYFIYLYFIYIYFKKYLYLKNIYITIKIISSFRCIEFDHDDDEFYNKKKNNALQYNKCFIVRYKNKNKQKI